jgi:hypothetical protein
LNNFEYFVQAIPYAQLIPFGETLGNPVVCMAFSPDSALHGKIYVWDWDLRASYQADSLQEFLGQLREYQEV